MCFSFCIVLLHLLSLTGVHLTLMATLKDDTFKPIQEIINYTFRKHHLQDFVILNDCLKICELLGTGEIYVCSYFNGQYII